MRTTLPDLLRICLRLTRLSDLRENLCDSKHQTLFQSHLTGLGNRSPGIAPIIDRIAFSIGLMEHLLQVQYFTNLFLSGQES